VFFLKFILRIGRGIFRRRENLLVSAPFYNDSGLEEVAEQPYSPPLLFIYIANVGSMYSFSATNTTILLLLQEPTSF
jgi:hypothetical protein